MIDRPPVLDAAGAAVVLVLLVVERSAAGLDGPPLLVVAPAVVAAGALAWARTAPLLSYAVGTAALAVEALLVEPGTLTPYVNLLGVYALGLYGSRSHALWGPVILLAGIAAYFAGVRPAAAAGVPVGVVAVWLLAWALAYRSARRGEEREAVRLALRDEAVAGERARIAHELHDLLGHTLTVGSPSGRPRCGG